MNDQIYHKLAKVLDTLPNGFPATESGVEIKLLKKIFSIEDAELFCDLRLKFETPKQITERSGRPLEGLEKKLLSMRDRGQLLKKRYKLTNKLCPMKKFPISWRIANPSW